MSRMLLSVVTLTITACASTPDLPLSTPFRPAPADVRASDGLQWSQPPSSKSEGETIPQCNNAYPSELAIAPDSATPYDQDLEGAILDDDKCPSEFETRNGYQDDDGCPDRVPRDLAFALKAYQYTESEAEDLRSRGVASPKMQAQLKRVADIMGKYPGVRLEITAHSDHMGEVKYSRTPTNQLARAVVIYLTVKGGVSSDRLFSMGAESDMPLATNRSARGRSLNRRVEFALVVEY